VTASLRHPPTRFLALAAAVALVLAGLGALHQDRQDRADHPHRTPVQEATLRLVPADGHVGTSTCVDPVHAREWRVTWRALATARPADSRSPSIADALAERAATIDLIPTGFAVRPTAVSPTAVSPTTVRPTAGAWRSTDLDRWELRWAPTPTEVLSAQNQETWVRVGPLAGLAGVPLSVAQDPRYVTPDGQCTVYLVPFVAGTAGADNRVAVVGDSLVAQLSSPRTVLGLTDGDPSGAGALLQRLGAGHEVEIEGQPGRRWTARPDPPSALEGADATLRDELRGLRSARATVVALGTNDAGWVALASGPDQFEQRLAWVLTRLEATLDELAGQARCTVLATVAGRGRTYAGSAPGRYERATGRINALLRERATARPDDRLHLLDWARVADPHGRDDPEPWFGRDTIHLDRAGLTAYADALARGISLCP
jgi:lysophospholipase L1-like esterase